MHSHSSDLLLFKIRGSAYRGVYLQLQGVSASKDSASEGSASGGNGWADPHQLECFLVNF